MTDKERIEKEKAVEALKRVKENTSKELEYMWNNNAELTCYDRSIIDGVLDYIDQLIKEYGGEYE